MNASIYQYQHLSEELSELLEAFELKLLRSKEKLVKAQDYDDADKVINLLSEVRVWNSVIRNTD